VKVSIGSIIRDGAGYVDRYADQIEALRTATDMHTFHSIIVEGDSRDDTYAKLKARFNGSVTHASHGGPAFGSVGDPVRFKQSSWTWEHVLELIHPRDEAFVYLEADLLWQPAAILRLLFYLQCPGVDVVAPMCWYGPENRAYDLWGMRGTDGMGFGPFPPFHHSLTDDNETGLYPINSAGSCLAMRGEVARTCHFQPADLAVVGWCQNMREHGYKLFLDPMTKVIHP
jgi:GT2 family glycosyltransferase